VDRVGGTGAPPSKFDAGEQPSERRIWEEDVAARGSRRECVIREPYSPLALIATYARGGRVLQTPIMGSARERSRKLFGAQPI